MIEPGVTQDVATCMVTAIHGSSSPVFHKGQFIYRRAKAFYCLVHCHCAHVLSVCNASFFAVGHFLELPLPLRFIFNFFSPCGFVFLHISLGAPCVLLIGSLALHGFPWLASLPFVSCAVSPRAWLFVIVLSQAPCLRMCTQSWMSSLFYSHQTLHLASCTSLIKLSLGVMQVRTTRSL